MGKGMGASPKGDRATHEREWIPGFEGLYSVSAAGEVFSHHFLTPRKISTAATDKDGYPIVTLTPRNGRRKAYLLHRLVCRTFRGEPTALHNEAAHLNGDRKDASATNLKWVSKVENHAHRLSHGTEHRGEKHPQAKLSERQARWAIGELAKGRNAPSIAAELGHVRASAIAEIRRGRNWRHLERPWA